MRVLTSLIMSVIMCFGTLVSSGEIEVNTDPAYAVINVDTGEVLAEENANTTHRIASLTKIITAITVIENNSDLNAKYVVPASVVGVEGSSIYLQEGEEVTILELLQGLMLRSGNDSAKMLAIITSGSVEAFAKLMNATADEAGMINSHFVNPHGLDAEGHYSTAMDLARVTAYAMKNSVFRDIVGSKVIEGERTTYYNKNKMLTEYEGANGVKTGYTSLSGKCLVTTATRDGITICCVVLACNDMWEKSKELLDEAFETLGV